MTLEEAMRLPPFSYVAVKLLPAATTGIARLISWSDDPNPAWHTWLRLSPGSDGVEDWQLAYVIPLEIVHPIPSPMLADEAEDEEAPY